MEREKLTLSIKKKEKDDPRTIGYEFKIGDWVLGRGVLNVNIDFPPLSRPKVIIEACVDEIDMDEFEDIELELRRRYRFENTDEK
ncbi:hypothetical protein ACSMFR_05485 [Listeria aquatica]|uniref:hypothetical protein n=1 Tax=Listeria aquatica TaxID=1494960 RepID=UPI003F7221BE